MLQRILFSLLFTIPFLLNAQSYIELNDTKPKDAIATWQQALTKDFMWEWGSTDVRYPKYVIPNQTELKNRDGDGQVVKLQAWKGEKVNAQALIYTKVDLNNVSFSVTQLKSHRHTIAASNISINPVSYVLTDELNKGGGGGCGGRPNPTMFDSSIVADVLNNEKENWVVAAFTTRPVWLSIDVPRNSKPGIYIGTFNVKTGAKVESLKIELQVIDRELPAVKDWTFHLDLWQNPYAVARFHNVEPWSAQHFEYMKPVMKLLANAGQKVITTTVTNRAWNGQTQDPFGNMIQRTLKKDGSWSFNYEIFDKWVHFMMKEIGIKDQINCYTMVPWAMRFDYFDEASGTVKYLNTGTADIKYTEFWTPFIKDFAKHLKKKGWFDITTIAMDERSMADMMNVIKLVKNAEPDFKITLAGVKYEDRIEADIYDYSISYGQIFPQQILSKRDNAKKHSTYYTSCAQPFPNTFTFSNPIEATWLGWHSMAEGYSGYLRWAYNSWTTSPLQDSRFRTWAAGDTYLVYPEGRSSIRFEKLREGIQDYEKIKILRKEWANQPEKLKNINEIVASFKYKNKSPFAPEEQIKAARRVLNSL